MTTTLLARPAADATIPAPLPRFDVYTGIHKALRAFMHDTLTRLGRMDVADPADRVATLGQVDDLLAELRHHVRNEDDFVHPAIEARRPGGSARTGGEHVEHLAEIALLEEAVRELRVAGTADRAPLALRLYRELAAFVADNLRHMQVEETANQAALWALYTDAELETLVDRLLASLPPQEMATVTRWMARALSPQELVAMCEDARQKMPSEAFDAMFDLVRRELDPARLAQVARALGRPAVPGLVSEHVPAG